MKHVNFILENQKEVIAFLKTRFPLYHQSNVFFRDLQFGIQAMLERKGMKAGYTESERIAREFAKRLEEQKILISIDQQSWVMNYPEFKTPVTKAPAASAKPAAAAPARPSAPADAKSPVRTPSVAAEAPTGPTAASTPQGPLAVPPGEGSGT